MGWGDNWEGELGNRYYYLGSSSVPVQVIGLCTPLTTQVKDASPESNMISVFPNPSSSVFTVDLKNKTGKTKIRVRDMLGNCLVNKDCPNEINPTIDLSNQPKGIYFLEIVSGSERVVKKIVLE